MANILLNDLINDIKPYLDVIAEKELRTHTLTVSVADSSVATAEIVNGMVVVKGLKAGQTSATITGSRTDKFVITVREKANGNGWL